MSRYLDPKADIVFKRIFADHPHLLISFLNAIMPLAPDSPIVEISYLPSEQVPDIPEFRRTIVDVKCKDARNRVFIVEMQMNWTSCFKERLLFGTSQAFVKQLNKGDDYKLLEPVYGLGLVAERYDPNEEWYHHYQLVKKDSSEGDVIEHLQLIFVELPKCPIYSLKEKKLRLLWLRFLQEINEHTKTVAQELFDVPEIAQAIGLTEEAAYTPGELERYHTYWDAVSSEKTLINASLEKGITIGEQRGVERGIAIGEERGVERGIAIGEAQAEKKRYLERQEMANKMLDQGIDLDRVAQLMGLTQDEVDAIICAYELN